MSCAADAAALAEAIVAVFDFVGLPYGWEFGPLFTQALGRAFVTVTDQIQAYGQAIATKSKAQYGFVDVIVQAIQPRVDEHIFTFEQIFSQVLVYCTPGTA